MTVTQTSRQSYHNLNRHKLNSEKMKIKSFLDQNPDHSFSLRQISYTTGLALNVVWSRTSELCKKGQATQGTPRRDEHTGMIVQTYKGATKQ